jgi:hypothetical protein
MQGKAYYLNPVALTGQSPAPAPATRASPLTASFNVTLGGAGVDPGSASVGNDVSFHQDLSATADGSVLIDFELYDASGTKVWQSFDDNVSVAAGQATTRSTTFTVPDSLPAGAYQFKSGVFSAGWGTLYAWNDQAGVLTID